MSDGEVQDGRREVNQGKQGGQRGTGEMNGMERALEGKKRKRGIKNARRWGRRGEM